MKPVGIFGNYISKCPDIMGKRTPISPHRVPPVQSNKVKDYSSSVGSPCNMRPSYFIINIATIPSWYFLSDYTVPSWYFMGKDTVPSRYFLCDGTVPSRYFLRDGTVPSRYFLRDGTVPSPNHYLNKKLRDVQQRAKGNKFMQV